ncbi:hypothetical protein M9434_005596 [Picochlorum sp. BPE23]|nr:hypothetical protein M9434_005596 [Picochlorum sp. BPE23]
MGEDGMPHGIRKRVIKDNGIKSATHAHTYEKKQEKKNASVPGGTTATTAADHTSTFRVLLLLPLMGLLVLFGVVGTLRMRQHSVLPTSRHSSMKVFTTEELGMYDGKERRGGPLYLAILGSVFDVTQGKRHYGPGGSYHFFAGRDASRAYTTGKFDVDLHDDIRDLSPERMAELVDWRNFYINSAKYVHVGRVIGRFYDDKGNPLPLLGIVESHAADYKKNTTESSASGARCGFRWHKDSGSQVYCDEKDKTVPRKVRSDDGGEACLCLPLTEAAVNDTVQGYPGCAADSRTCSTSPGKQSSTSSSI